MQFAEGLSDRQAADAVRARIDCKYALSLELSDPGFDASVLCEFRARLLEGGSERLLFEHLLDRFRGMRLVKARGKQRYVRRLDDEKLPKSKEARQTEAEKIGADGYGRWLRASR
jgi:transposase